MINSCVYRPMWVYFLACCWEGLQSCSWCRRDLPPQLCTTAGEVPRPGLVNEPKSFAPFQTLTVSGWLWEEHVNSSSVRSIEYSSISSLEGCTNTQEADDPPDPPNVLLTSTKSGHGKQTSGLMALRGFFWLFCGSGRMGHKAKSIMLSPHPPPPPPM